MRLEGKIAVVTGAASGFGEGIARKFVAEGAKVVVADRDGAGAERAAAALGKNAVGVRADVTNARDVQGMVAAAVERFGSLDVLVNNAGTLSRKAALTVTADDMRPEFETNVLGLVRVINAMLPLLRRSDAARVVNVSSTSAVFTHTADPSTMFAQSHDSFAYAASKAAVTMLTLKYANAFRADPALADAKVNAVTPGYVATDLNGFQGVRTTEQGARASVRYATLGPDGPSGGFFDDEGPVPW